MKKSVISDAQLISLYKKGDDRAFQELLERYKSKVFTTAYLIVKDRYLAEDITQEVFIKAIKKINCENYDEQGKFGPWVQRIAHNLAVDHFRKAKRYPTIVMEDGSNVFNTIEFVEDSFEDKRIKEETNVKLKNLIEKLPATQKEVLIMRHYAEMSFNDIAEATGVSINTALGRMRYALINLRKLMGVNEKAYDKKLYPE